MKLILIAALVATLASGAEKAPEPATVKLTDAEIAKVAEASRKVQAANKALAKAQAQLAVAEAQAAVDAASEDWSATFTALAKAAKCEKCSMDLQRQVWVKPAEGK
jgi:hypothetical protein